MFLLTFWTLTALSRADIGEPSASRYVYVGAVFLLVVTAELLGPSPGWPPAVVALCLAALSVWANFGILQRAAGALRETSAVVGAELAVVEAYGRLADPSVPVDPVRAPGLTIGPYLDAVLALGSPALPLAAVPLQPAVARTEADRIGLQLLPPREAPGAAAPGGPPPAVTGHTSKVPDRPSCLQAGGGQSVVAEVPPQGLLLEAVEGYPLELSYVRFGDTPQTAEPSRLGVDAPVVHLPTDDSVTLPWRVAIGAVEPVVLCAARSIRAARAA